MNYYEARQRSKDQRWDFTCMNDGRIWPVGYCHPWSDWPDDLKTMVSAEYRQYLAEKAKYHGDGHTTKEEAEKCYRDYELSTKLRETACSTDEQHKCAVEGCGAWTSKGLGMGDSRASFLCDSHRIRETYEKLYPFIPGRQIISSY